MRIALATLFVMACDPGPDAEPPATPATRVETSEPTPLPESKRESKREAKPVDTPVPAPDTSPIERGPAAPGGGATTQQREGAVLELLAGAAPASRFVVVDVDPGQLFEKDLRDTVAPNTGVGIAKVRQKPPTVSAGLDRDIVRRIVRSHINEVRHCYNQGLVRNATLGGDIDLAFTIDPDGKVSNSAVSRTTMRGSAGKAVAECMPKAVKRWKFPKPEGGVKVDVVSPFALSYR